jgi:hypothetical protein
LLPTSLLAAAVAALAVATATPLAYARTSHVYESVIEPPEPLVSAKSLTVYSGDLFVAENLQVPSGESRTEEYAPSITSPGKYEFVSKLQEPSPEKHLNEGIAFGTVTGETEMYVGEEGSPAGVDVFGVPCGGLECAGFQEKWTGAKKPEPSGAI